MLRFFQKGNEALAQDDFNTALRYYEAGIQKDSSFPDIFNNRGVVQSRLGNLEAAQLDYARAISLDSSYADAYLNRGNAYFDQQDFSQALEDYQQVIQLRPDSSTAYLLRARTYLELKEYAAAQQDLSRLIQIEPQNPLAYDSRGFIFLQMGDYEKAQQDLQKALSLNPEQDLAWANLALWALKTEQKDLASEYVQKALELKPNETYSKKVQIRVYLAQDSLEQAQEALEQWPTEKDMDIEYLFARLHFEKGEVQASIQDLQGLIAQQKTSASVFNLLGECYFEEGKLEKACEMWKKATKLNVGESEVYIKKYCQ